MIREDAFKSAFENLIADYPLRLSIYRFLTWLLSSLSSLFARRLQLQRVSSIINSDDDSIIAHIFHFVNTIPTLTPQLQSISSKKTRHSPLLRGLMDSWKVN